MLLKWIEIDLSAVEDNIRTVQGLSASKWMAVVKADAYGHGAAEVGRLALKYGAHSLGVLTLEEGLELRKAGLSAPIAILAPALPQSAREIVRGRFIPTVDSPDLAEALNRAAGRRSPVPVFVDLDFGLGRWGIPPREAEKFLKSLKRYPKVKAAGLSTHLDYVPGKNAVEAEEKLESFHRIAKSAKRRNPSLIAHAANSSILLDFPHWQMDLVRVGNLLYGINPTSKKIALRNPWQFHARIIALREVAKGRPIGYASEYVAPRRMKVAALPVGYADGLTMEPAERLIRLGGGMQYWGLLRGHEVPFIGRCGISHVLVDVSRVAGAQVGDAVSLPLRRTAAHSRIPRIYKGVQH